MVKAHKNYKLGYRNKRWPDWCTDNNNTYLTEESGHQTNCNVPWWIHMVLKQMCYPLRHGTDQLEAAPYNPTTQRTNKHHNDQNSEDKLVYRSVYHIAVDGIQSYGILDAPKHFRRQTAFSFPPVTFFINISTCLRLILKFTDATSGTWRFSTSIVHYLCLALI